MINCSVTVMPLWYDNTKETLYIGFLRRPVNDESFGGMLVAPGGKVENIDGELIDGVPYFSVESAAIRELLEESKIHIKRHDLFYLCSLTLPHNGRVVISYYCWVQDNVLSLEWLGKDEIQSSIDFAPGMKQEALLLLDSV